MLKIFYLEIKNQFNSNIKILRSDNAKQYLDKHLSQFLKYIESCINPLVSTRNTPKIFKTIILYYSCMLYILLCPSVRSILGASHILDKSTQ